MPESKLETKIIDIAKDLRAGIEEAGDDAVKVAAWVQKNSAQIQLLASLGGPEAASVSATGLALTSLAVNAVKNAGSAASANGVSVTLDQATIAAVEKLIAAIEKI